MEECAGCGKQIHRDEPVSASFSQEGQRRFFHKTCEDRAEHLTKWKEEAAWAFRATRLTTSNGTRAVLGNMSVFGSQYSLLEGTRMSGARIAVSRSRDTRRLLVRLVAVGS